MVEKGDGNNRYFYNYCRRRWNTNKILAIEDDNGSICESHKDISAVVIDFFRNSLGSTSKVNLFPDDLVLPCLSAEQSTGLTVPVTKEEVYVVLKRMGRKKCPGPDGFTVEFYLAAWDIVKDDFINAILHFFSSFHLPRMINTAAIALIPKQENPSRMTHFRPIS